MFRLHSTAIILVLFVQFASAVFHNSNYFQSSSSFSAEKPFKRSADRLFKNFIGDDGRVYACSGRNFFAFENNGSIAWTVQLNYTCNANIAPVHGGSRKIYLVAESQVLKIHPLKIGTSESAVEVFHGREQGAEGEGEIIGVAVSNTVGELYSLSVRRPYFKWIQDLSSYGNKFVITPGNNGRLYVTIPDKALILALEVSMGNVLWQGSIGPLSSADYEPVVDVNGWISIGSLDGFLYSFSPTGALKKFPKSANVNRVIQVNPVLDCSGYAVYVSQTETEEKNSHIIGDCTYVSATKPMNAIFTLLVPASDSVYWSESNPSKFLFNLSQSDLKHFVLDERTLLSFIAVSRNGNPLPCHTTRQKLASSCSHVKPTKNVSIYTGDQSTIIIFLLSESVLLVILAALINYCCIFWKKKKLQSLNLGKFLEKRRSLRIQKKKFDRTITELEQKTSEEAIANEVVEKLNDLVKEREGIKRKLSTTYSLGRDGVKSGSKSILPLYDGKSRSHSFQVSNKESVTIFHSCTDGTTSSSDSTTCSSDSSLDGLPDKELSVMAMPQTNTKEKAKVKAKAPLEVESSSDYENTYEGFMNPVFMEDPCNEIEEVKLIAEGKVEEKTVGGNTSLRRRNMSFH